MNPSMPRADSGAPQIPGRRVLTLWDLVIYGVVLIQPIAPVGIFGIASALSRGHAVTTILIAMVAMLLTASSYGTLAAAYPSAGSAYTYVGRGFGSHAGFLVGWAMFLDYLIIPVINVIYGALTLQRLVPVVPFFVWAALFAGGITLFGARGVRSMARANTVLLAVMCAVVAAFVALAVRYLFAADGWHGVFATAPFYDRSTFAAGPLMAATSLAALTYIGFDGVTTLAEDVRDPRRTVPIATVLVCLLTGVFSAVEVYLGQRVWPDYHTFPNLETAFLDVTQRVGGTFLFQAMGAVLVIACFGSGLAGQVGASRLLYAMGRDDMLPRSVFGRWDPARSQPTTNILIIGALSYAATLLVSYQRSAELLNFGAFLAFMGVNLAAIRHAYASPGGPLRRATGGLIAALGFAFCLGIWWSLSMPAKILGGLWFVVGLVLLAVKTRGFRLKPPSIQFAESP